MFHGLLLVLVPFLLVFSKKDFDRSFPALLTYWILIHLGVNFALQISGQFNYAGIITFHTIIALIIIFKFSLGLKSPFALETDQIKEGIAVSVVMLAAFICLLQVHYFYSGVYTSVQYHLIVPKVPMQYAYPYFADEWNAVAMIRRLFETEGLPVVNPYFSYPVNFINFELFFHSFIAGFFLLLNLDPVTGYAKLAIGFGIIIIMLCYLILRKSKVSRLSAMVGSLSVLFITNGANLPGLWNLMPVTLGVIGLLLSIYFFVCQKIKQVGVCLFLMLLFYPPLFAVCFFPLSCAFLFKLKEGKRLVLYFGLIALSVALVLSVIVCASASLGSDLFGHVWSNILFLTGTKGSNPYFNPLWIIPIPVMILATFGIKEGFRRAVAIPFLLYVLIFFWLVYSQTLYRFMIEYARVVYVAAVMMCLLAGFGYDWILQKVEGQGFGKKTLKGCLALITFVIFLYGALHYTSGQNWKKLILKKVNSSEYFLPAPVANRYLHEDDLRIFSVLTKKRFLSLPWKGTVIGSATDNSPATTKEGTISVNSRILNEFIKGDCDQRWRMAYDLNLDYVYLPEFQCPDFKAIEQSREGLILYRFER